jgi:tRNA(Ile)-lysidine synthase
MINGWRWVLVDFHDLQPILTHSKIYVGLSGGLDSIALLHALSLLTECKAKLQAIHVHHGLSPHAHAWETFCRKQCQSLTIPLQVQHIKISGTENLESKAREARYAVYASCIQPGEALVLGHHLDDQLETFLLNALRGTGLTGLAAMPMHRVWQGIDIYRPMLSTPKSAIQAYANVHDLKWVEDESNQNIEYSRNFLRHEILPRLEKTWPHYRQSMMHTITSCQTVIQHLEQDDLEQIQAYDLNLPTLDLKPLRALNELQIFQILRLWFKHQDLPRPSLTLVREILAQMLMPKRQDSNPKMVWGDRYLYLYQDSIYCVKPQAPQTPALWPEFPMPYLGIQAISAKPGIAIHAKHDKVEVRYRQGGERLLYRGHHRELKKMFQEFKVPPFFRDTIPLIYVNDELKAVVGYWYADEPASNATQYQFIR